MIHKNEQVAAAGKNFPHQTHICQSERSHSAARPGYICQHHDICFGLYRLFVVQSCNLAITLDGFLNRLFDVDLLLLLGYVQLTKLLAESLGVRADISEDLLDIDAGQLGDILVKKFVGGVLGPDSVVTALEDIPMIHRLVFENALPLLLLYRLLCIPP